jgi:hypothetical protein
MVNFHSKGDMVMGLLQEIAESLGNENLKRLADGQGNFDDHGSPDLQSIQELVKNIDPKTLQQLFARMAQQVNPQEYSDHVTPGVGGTNPLGKLLPEGLATIATALLSRLKEGGAGNLASLGKDLGLTSTDPNNMNPDDVAAVARYAQQEKPEAFGKATAQIGQQKPELLHGFLGKAALALTAAALASHFIKLDRK